MVMLIIGGGIATVQNKGESADHHVDRHIKLQKPKRKNGKGKIRRNKK